jgi:hypothetical protein
VKGDSRSLSGREGQDRAVSLTDEGGVSRHEPFVAHISVLIIIAGLYLGLFLVNNVEQYQNQKTTDAAGH